MPADRIVDEAAEVETEVEELVLTLAIVVSDAGTSVVASETFSPEKITTVSWRVDWKPEAEIVTV